MKPRKNLLYFLVLVFSLFQSGYATCQIISQRSETVWFKEVSREHSQLDFQFANGSRGKFDLPEIMAGGMAAADFDKDGLIDLFFCQGGPIGSLDAKEKVDPPCEWYKNLGNMVFEKKDGLPAGPSYAMGAWPCDFDKDGWIDLFVTGWKGWALYRNKGEWRFEDMTDRLGKEPPAWSTAAVWCDLNRDGHQDLFVGCYLDYEAESAPYCAAPDGKRDYCGPEDFPAVPDRLYFGKGDGRFENRTDLLNPNDVEGRALGAMCGDFNNDQLPDIFVANDGTANNLWIQQADGTFKDEALSRGLALQENGEPLAGMGVAAMRSPSGGIEIFVSNFMDRGTVHYKSTKPGFFRDNSNGSGIQSLTRRVNGFGIVAADFDSDGISEIVQANGHVLSRKRLGMPFEMPVMLLVQDGSGKFSKLTKYQFPMQKKPVLGRGVIATDFNNDGRTDLIVSRLDGTPILLENLLEQKTASKRVLKEFIGGSYLSGLDETSKP